MEQDIIKGSKTFLKRLFFERGEEVAVELYSYLSSQKYYASSKEKSSKEAGEKSCKESSKEGS